MFIISIFLYIRDFIILCEEFFKVIFGFLLFREEGGFYFNRKGKIVSVLGVVEILRGDDFGVYV